MSKSIRNTEHHEDLQVAVTRYKQAKHAREIDPTDVAQAAETTAHEELGYQLFLRNKKGEAFSLLINSVQSKMTS